MSTSTTAGQAAYEAYAGSTGWKSAVSGAPLPPWDGQADAVKKAWEASAEAARSFVVPRPPRDNWDDSRVYRDEELTYAATSRCKCGAGLVALKNADFWSSWRCSAIVTGRAPARAADPHDGKHVDLPFSMYEVKSEDQPSAKGATTRPAKAAL